MSSFLGGLASLNRWEGLKEWHKRHQDLLGERRQDTNTEALGTEQSQCMSTVHEDESTSLLLKDQQVEENLFLPPPPKHDLSIIPEADEDSRSRDGDLDSSRNKQGMQKSAMVQRTKQSNLRIGEENQPKMSDPVRGGNKRQPNPLPSNSVGEEPPSGKIVKKPFLKRGQGLIKYNLRPEDTRKPYRDGASSVGGLPNPSGTDLNRLGVKQKAKQLSSQRSQPAGNSKGFELTAPMQRLVLPIPSQTASSIEIGTWSQVLGGDSNSGSESVLKETITQPSLEEGFQKKTLTFQHEPYRNRNTVSPQRKKMSKRLEASPEVQEDQESLAAYLDLEQHVGNASFCSTSSKVDRLVAKSSNPTIHQSNPDTITQAKLLSPVKTGRKFFSSLRDDINVPEDCVGMWTASDLETLIKARARRSGSLLKPYSEPSKSKLPLNGRTGSVKPYVEPISQVIGEDSTEIPTSEKVSSCDWMLEAIGPARKPHLMKTMPGIDLDSSLIKNARAPTRCEEDDTSSSETESSSSDEDFEDFTSGMDNCIKVTPPKQPSRKSIEMPLNSKEDEIVSHAPFKLVDDATLEEINQQIESHLSTLRKEIETLQSAKAKSQKYTSNLEKKVQELEHRLMLEARSSTKRLEDEREGAAKRLAEEQAKFSKEKIALQRTLREERRKAPDPITQQELLSLKLDITQGEEKWRSDRAKARGLESNLRIQITNLRRENEKLKEENNKLRREKETAINTAKAKSSSNTRVINSIAQQLGNNKPKVTIVREENSKSKTQTSSSAYNLKGKDSAHPKSVATIDSLPKVPYVPNEWSSDEEIDLGKEISDEDDFSDNVNDKNKKLSCATEAANNLRNSDRNVQKLSPSIHEILNLEEAQAKYNAMFGNDADDSDIVVARAVKNQDCAQGSAILHTGGQNSATDDLNTEKFVKTIHHADGKVEQMQANGTRVITHPDGTWERHSSTGSVMTVPPSGWPIHISYCNGDQLEKQSNGITRYFYAKNSMWQTSYPDGEEELKYPNGQVERRDKDGSVKVLLPGNDGQSGIEIPSTSNTISVEKLPNGNTLIILPNGERELHTQDYMKKEFLDGTIKFIFNDGSQETRYPSGRIRIKDAQGNLVKDTSLVS